MRQFRFHSPLSSHPAAVHDKNLPIHITQSALRSCYQRSLPIQAETVENAHRLQTPSTRNMRIVDPVSAPDEEYWLWEAISHGTREIAVYAWYPMSSGFESNGYGLIHLDGTLTDRAHAAGNTAAIIAANAEDLNRAEPASAQVAVLYDLLSYMVEGSPRLPRWAMQCEIPFSASIAHFSKSRFQSTSSVALLSMRPVSASTKSSSSLIRLCFQRVREIC